MLTLVLARNKKSIEGTLNLDKALGVANGH